MVLSAVVVTAAVVVMKLPRWRQKAKEQHQESVLQGMTPDKAIALCGHLVLDEIQASQPTATRRLVIRNDYALAVELDFRPPPLANPKRGSSPEFKIPPAKSSAKLVPAKSAFCRALTRSKRKSPIKSPNRNCRPRIHPGVELHGHTRT